MPRASPPPERRAPLSTSNPLPSTPQPSQAHDLLVMQPLGWSAGFQVNATEHVSPAHALGGTLFVEAALPGAGASPALRAGVFFSQARVALPSGAGGKFQWFLALVEGCPIRLAPDRRLGIYPCLAAHIGVLHGQGHNLDENQATANLWADMGLVVRVRVGLARGILFELQGMFVVPLRRLSFEVQDQGPGTPSTTVFAVPAYGARAGMGLAYEFR